jgi:protoporphyrin/coproporphyrin ferrochelatase
LKELLVHSYLFTNRYFCDNMKAETQPVAARTGILLVNLGTPDAPTVPAVRKYLREFLMDGRVIDIPVVLRFILVQGIIAPFRAPKSTKIYKEVWLKEGSPLKIYGYELAHKLQDLMGTDYVVKLAMRYQSPSIAPAIREFIDEQVDKIVVVPLFPQYASASSGSVIEKVMSELSKYQTIPETSFVGPFHSHPAFIDNFVKQGLAHMAQHQYDHVLFSYHGIPQRHIRKGDYAKQCKFGSCCNTLTSSNALCYRAQCFATSRLIAEKMGIGTNYTVSFQSRLGSDPWIQPYTDKEIKEFPKKGYLNVLAFSPAFVADCLETTVEVGDEYKEIFEESGGKHWQLVESLNASDEWVQGMKDIITPYLVKPIMLPS